MKIVHTPMMLKLLYLVCKTCNAYSIIFAKDFWYLVLEQYRILESSAFDKFSSD